MSNKREYSRLVFKRTTQPNVVPTIPSGDTIDSSWRETDLLVGEAFININDDKMWFRTNNGIVEVPMSGVSSSNYFTELAYLSGNTLHFDRTDQQNAYQVDLSSLAGSGSTVEGDYIPLTITGNTTVTYGANDVILSGTNKAWEYAGDYSAGYTPRSIVDKQYVDSISPSLTGDTVFDDISASTVSILNSGTTQRDFTDYSSNVVKVGTSNSSIIAGSGNTILTGVDNTVIASGDNITANTSNTLYADNAKLAENGGAIYSGGTDLYNIFATSTSGSTGGGDMDFYIPLEDETTNTTTGTDKVTLYAPYKFKITKLKASLSTAGSNLTQIDLNVNSSSVLNVELEIFGNSNVGSTTNIKTAGEVVEEDDKITVDIDAVGSGAKGAKVYIIGKRM